MIRLAGLPRRSRLVGDTLWVGVGQLISALARLAGLRVLTSLLTRDVYGEMALLQGFVVLGSTVFLWPSLQAILRFYPDAARERRLNGLRRIAARALWGSGALAAAVLIVSSWNWSATAGRPLQPVVLLLLLATLVTEIQKTFEANLLSAARRQSVWAAWTAADGCARPLFAVIAIRALGPTLPAVFLGYAVGGAVTNLAFRAWALRGTDDSAGADAEPWMKRNRKEFFAFAAPLAALALPAWIFNMGDRYVLGAAFGEAAVGPYAAAYALGTAPLAFWGGIGTTAFRPVYFQAVADGDRAKARSTLFGWMLAFGASSLLGVLVLGVLSPWLARIALGPAFRVAAGLVPWIAAASGLQVFQQILETVLYADRRTGRVLIEQAIAAVLALVLYLVLVPRMGAKGAAVATFLAVVGSTLVTLAVVAWGRRLARRTEAPIL